MGYDLFKIIMRALLAFFWLKSILVIIQYCFPELQATLETMHGIDAAIIGMLLGFACWYLAGKLISAFEYLFIH